MLWASFHRCREETQEATELQSHTDHYWCSTPACEEKIFDWLESFQGVAVYLFKEQLLLFPFTLQL